MAEPGSTSYDGFLSYSHAADGLLAPRLQAGLQRFAKPWWRRRALHIFRDEASLSANPHLWSSITKALDQSDWFVLLLSPEAADSEWVNREIDYWIEHKDKRRILPAVTDGEFGWAAGDVTGDAVPPSLRGVFEEEPRWVDLGFARSESQLNLRHGRFRDAVADIAATVRGIPKDDLESEEIRQHRRTVRTAWAAGAMMLALLVAATTGAIVAYNATRDAQDNAALAEQRRLEAESLASSEREARSEAEKQRAFAQDESKRAADEADRAEENAAIARANAELARSRELAASAINVLKKDPELSLLLSLEAARIEDPPPESVTALHEAVLSHRALLSYPVDDWTATTFLPDGSRFLIVDGDSVMIIDASSGVPVRSSRLPTGLLANPLAFATTDSSQILIHTYWDRKAFDENRLQEVHHPRPGIYQFDIETGDLSRRPVDWPCSIQQVAVNSYGWIDLDLPLYLLAGAPSAGGMCDGQEVAILEARSDGSTEELVRYPAADMGIWEIAVSADGRYLAHEVGGENLLLDIESREVVPVGSATCCGTSNVLNGDGSLWVSIGAVGQIANNDWGLFDTRTGEMARTLDGLGSSSYALFSSDESILVTSGMEGNAHVWNVETGFEIARMTGLGGVAGQIHLNADGTRLLTKTAGVIKLWSIPPLGEKSALDMYAAPETRHYLRDEFVSRNLDIVGGTAAILYAGDPSCDVVIFDIASGEVQNVVESVTIQDAALSPDGRLLAAQQELESGWIGSVRIHDAHSGEPLVTMEGWCTWDWWPLMGPDCRKYPDRPFPDFVQNLEFSPDGSFLAAAGKDFASESVTVWSSASGEMLLNVGPGAELFAFSPDGARFVVFHHREGDLISYETENWTEINRWNGAADSLPPQMGLMGYTPDGTHLVVIGTYTSELAVIDVAKRRIVGSEVVAAEGYVRHFDLSPDGSRIAVISTDGFVRVYELRSADGSNLKLELAIPVFDKAARLNIGFLDDTHIFALPGTGPGVTLTLDLDELLQIGRDRLTRSFTQAECVTYHVDPCPDLPAIRDG